MTSSAAPVPAPLRVTSVERAPAGLGRGPAGRVHVRVRGAWLSGPRFVAPLLVVDDGARRRAFPARDESPPDDPSAFRATFDVPEELALDGGLTLRLGATQVRLDVPVERSGAVGERGSALGDEDAEAARAPAEVIARAEGLGGAEPSVAGEPDVDRDGASGERAVGPAPAGEGARVIDRAVLAERRVRRAEQVEQELLRRAEAAESGLAAAVRAQADAEGRAAALEDAVARARARAQEAEARAAEAERAVDVGRATAAEDARAAREGAQETARARSAAEAALGERDAARAAAEAAVEEREAARAAAETVLGERDAARAAAEVAVEERDAARAAAEAASVERDAALGERNAARAAAEATVAERDAAGAAAQEALEERDAARAAAEAAVEERDAAQGALAAAVHEREVAAAAAAREREALARAQRARDDALELLARSLRVAELTAGELRSARAEAARARDAVDEAQRELTAERARRIEVEGLLATRDAHEGDLRGLVGTLRADLDRLAAREDLGALQVPGLDAELEGLGRRLGAAGAPPSDVPAADGSRFDALVVAAERLRERADAELAARRAQPAPDEDDVALDAPSWPRVRPADPAAGDDRFAAALAGLRGARPAAGPAPTVPRQTPADPPRRATRPRAARLQGVLARLTGRRGRRA